MAISKGWRTIWGVAGRLRSYLGQPVDILPLAIFRVAFGGLMFCSSLRFILNGWVDALYIQPQFHFSYFGFEWVKPLGAPGMTLVFAALLLLSLFILLGLFYRPSIALFFVLFTYVELIDQATYLNHYYFISLLSLLLCFLPAHRHLSLDAWRRPSLRAKAVPRWTILAPQLQLGIVYFFAGAAKLNSDWLLQGKPMAIWLKAQTGFPLIGPLFDYDWLAILLSWAAAAYDLTIAFWLRWRRTRGIAWLTVIVFHLLTAALFPIGVFPWVMIATTLIFFDSRDFRSVFKRLGLRLSQPDGAFAPTSLSAPAKLMLALFFFLQLLLPLRHLLYPGDVNWTMEGYRFAWRVMLNEKAGFATFYVVDETLGATQAVYPGQHLTAQQARHMVYQPDMILQFAHYLADAHPGAARHQLAVYAEVYVSHNGRGSKLLIDPRQNLLEVGRDLPPAAWILRY